MDKLKKYLAENRDELDVDMPGEALWQRIRETTQPVKKPVKVISMFVKYAAAACIASVVIAGSIWFLSSNKQAINQPVVIEQIDNKKSSPDTDLVAKKPQLAEPSNFEKTVIKKVRKNNQITAGNRVRKSKKIIHHQNSTQLPTIENNVADELGKSYAQLVNLQLNRLRITPVYAEDANYFNDFKMQLKQMDEDEAALKKDIKRQGLNDVLLQQLINIYQQKLIVLKNLQTEINKMNNQVKQKQLPTDSIKNHFINI